MCISLTKNYFTQVILCDLTLSPIVGGHQQPFERVTFHHLKKVTLNHQDPVFSPKISSASKVPTNIRASEMVTLTR